MGEVLSSRNRAEGIVWTIGHSTHSLPDFLGILRDFGIRELLDVRTVPRSRFNPQFNRDTLPGHLFEVGIAYIHMAGLGGLRKEKLESENIGWRNSSFRGFADYMETGEFEGAIEELMVHIQNRRTVLMCAEAVPWRCHRSLIADALLIRRVRVEHIMADGTTRPHSLTPFARVSGTRITYPSS